MIARGAPEMIKPRKPLFINNIIRLLPAGSIIGSVRKYCPVYAIIYSDNAIRGLVLGFVELADEGIGLTRLGL